VQHDVKCAQVRQEPTVNELAELRDALHRLELLKAAAVSFERDLELAFSWPTDKPVKSNQAQKFDRRGRLTKYNRARPKWKGRHGYEFVSAVLQIQSQDKCTPAAAIRQLKHSSPEKWPEKERDLQRRFQEVKDYWGPWCRVAMRLTAEIENLLAETEPLVSVKT
jgi:hypothetical protein